VQSVVIGNYNEYYLPNNDFLYRDDLSIDIIRSKKSLLKFKQELKKEFSQSSIDNQPILNNGIKTCILAHVVHPHTNSAGFTYLLRDINNKSLPLDMYEPFTMNELENMLIKTL
jgi:hypothetical protein